MFWTSVQFSRSVMSNSLWPPGLQHARLPCLSPTPGACSNLYIKSLMPSNHLSLRRIPFSSHLQSFPASGSFPMSQFFTSGSQKYWSFIFSINPFKKYSRLISFRLDCLNLLAGDRVTMSKGGPGLDTGPGKGHQSWNSNTVFNCINSLVSLTTLWLHKMLTSGTWLEGYKPLWTVFEIVL